MVIISAAVIIKNVWCSNDFFYPTIWCHPDHVGFLFESGSSLGFFLMLSEEVFSLPLWAVLFFRNLNLHLDFCKATLCQCLYLKMLYKKIFISANIGLQLLNSRRCVDDKELNILHVDILSRSKFLLRQKRSTGLTSLLWKATFTTASMRSAPRMLCLS